MEDKPHFYRVVPRDWEAARFVVRSDLDPQVVLRSVAARIAELDPEISMVEAGLVRDQILSTVDGPRFFHRLLALFGLVALAIAGTGLVGIVKHTVAHRSREMAVRLALGALPTALHRLVVRQAIMPVLAGLTIGVGVCWWGTRLLATQLYGVNPRDTLAFASAGAVLLAVALIAAWFPARQVTRIAPMETLRAD
jgi:ABC-type antimicrobial peptide transport system permease subunit